ESDHSGRARRPDFRLIGGKFDRIGIRQGARSPQRHPPVLRTQRRGCRRCPRICASNSIPCPSHYLRQRAPGQSMMAILQGRVGISGPSTEGKEAVIDDRAAGVYARGDRIRSIKHRRGRRKGGDMRKLLAWLGSALFIAGLLIAATDASRAEGLVFLSTQL